MIPTTELVFPKEESSTPPQENQSALQKETQPRLNYDDASARADYARLVQLNLQNEPED